MKKEDKRKNNKGNVKMTPVTLAKLEAGFANSLTDEECCLYADINPSTLYRYIDKNPKFGERKERLKKKPNIRAKINWIQKINASDYQASKEWLERKSKDEFSLKQETKNENENTNINVEYDHDSLKTMTKKELEEARKKLIG